MRRRGRRFALLSYGSFAQRRFYVCVHHTHTHTVYETRSIGFRRMKNAVAHIDASPHTKQHFNLFFLILFQLGNTSSLELMNFWFFFHLKRKTIKIYYIVKIPNRIWLLHKTWDGRTVDGTGCIRGGEHNYNRCVWFTKLLEAFGCTGTINVDVCADGEHCA